MGATPKTFKHDHAVRDPAGRPIGRVILAGSKEPEIGKPFPVALLLIPVTYTKNILSFVFYLDGVAYRVPANTPKIRINVIGGQHKVNHVVLEPVS